MPANGQNKPGFFSNFGNALDSYNTPADKAAAADTAQNPYQSALIATASAEAEAKRQLNVAEAAAVAYPDNSTYQAQVALNQQRLSATQQAYTNAQTNFDSANAPIAKLNSEGVDTGTNGDTRTIGQSQATPASPLNITNDDSGAAWAPTSTGAGAGTTGNAATSRGAGDNPTPTTSTQQIISQTFGNGTQNTTIVAQPNVLDQYASYTYSISWYLLSPTQYNSVVLTQPFNTGGWQLLMQSGGAPITGRNQFFPVDYYMDNLEIDSNVVGGGTSGPNAAVSFKWKVTEPNGITLIDKLYQAVNSLYKNPTPSATTSEWDDNTTMLPGHGTNTKVNANQTPTTPNYLTAQHCFVIKFYGYDSNGKLVAPATGKYTTTGSVGGNSPQAVITKYYPFILQNITYRVAKSQIEYSLSALPAPHMYNTSSDRGTIPFDFALTGQTVQQLLSGSPVAPATANNTNGKDGRNAKPTPWAGIQPGIQPGLGASPIQPDGTFNQNQADTLNLLAAGNMGA